MSDLELYKNTLNDIKQRIQKAQAKAILSANAEMICMYWDIGTIIFSKQKDQGWVIK